VDRASLRVVDRSDDRLVIVGVWSIEGTVLSEGTRIPLDATSFPEVVRTGGPVIFESPDRAPSLIDQIMLDEGLQSWAVIPLRDGGSIEALLALSAREPGTFTMEDGPELIALAEAIQEDVLGLLAGGRSGG
jgi:GAF domain-containing protein